MKKTFLFIAVLFVVAIANETNETSKMFYNYRVNQIFYYSEITDAVACMLIPQNPIALDTYKWYRNVKEYEPEKAVRLTVKYWILNLKPEKADSSLLDNSLLENIQGNFWYDYPGEPKIKIWRAGDYCLIDLPGGKAMKERFHENKMYSLREW